MRSGSSDPETFFLQKTTQAIENRIATHLYAQAISKPVGVNDPEQPDYAAIAKECREKAEKTVPYLLRELGLLPKEEE